MQRKSHLRLDNKNKRLRWAKEDTGQRKIGKKCNGQTNLSLRCSDHKEIKNEMMLEEYLTPSVKHGGGNVAVLGGALVVVKCEICTG